MLVTRCIVSSLFLATWLYIAIANALALYDAHRRGGSTSLILFIGGVAGAIGLLICPLPGVAVWAWAPPLVDTGCAAAGFLIVLDHLREKRGREKAARIALETKNEEDTPDGR